MSDTAFAKRNSIGLERNPSRNSFASHNVEIPQFSNGMQAQREEIIDINSQVFKLGGETPTFTFRQETYVPKRDAISIIQRIEKEAKARIDQYKLYTNQLREASQQYEKESESYYLKLLNDFRKKSKAEMTNQISIMDQLKGEKDANQLQINLLKAQLTDSQNLLNEIQENQKQTEQQLLAVQEQNAKNSKQINQSFNEPEVETYVDEKEFLELKRRKKDNKEMIGYWYNQFEKENGRKPESEDFNQIKGLIFDRQNLQTKYTQMKATLIRLNKLPPDDFSKSVKSLQLVERLSQQKSESVFPLINSVEKKLFPIEISEQVMRASIDSFHQDTSAFQQEILKLKQEVTAKEQRNKELSQQIQSLEQLISKNNSENKVIKGLQNEIKKQKKLIDQRDERIDELIKRENLLKEQKGEIIQDLKDLGKEQQLREELKESQNIISDLELRNKRQQDQLGEFLKKGFYDSQNKEKDGDDSSQIHPTNTIEQFHQASANNEDMRELQDELEKIKDENKDLKEQIVFLRRFKEEFAMKQSSSVTSSNKLSFTKLEKLDGIDTEELSNKNKEQEQVIGLLNKKLEELLIDKQNNKSKGKDSKEVQKLQLQMDKFQEKIQSKKDKIKELKDKNSKLQEELQQQVKQNMQQISNTNSDFGRKIKDLEQEIKDLNEEKNNVLSHGKSALQKQTEKFQKQFEEIVEQHEALIEKKQDELIAFRTQLEKSEKGRAQLQDKVSDLEINLDIKTAEASKLHRQINDLEKLAGESKKLRDELVEFQNTNKQLAKEAKAAREDLDAFNIKFKEEQVKRKQLHNQLEDLKGKIRVYCRIRPLSNSELAREESKESVVKIIDEFQLTVMARNGPKTFEFDAIFGPDSTQDQVFDETKRLVQSAVDGYNVCIFAYGQTGSGKTFTVQGAPDKPGITPKSIDELFSIVQGLGSQFTVQLKSYMVELYKDELRDLLLQKNAPKVQLDIKESASGMVQIIGVQEVELNSIEEANKIFNFGLEHRMTRATKMNDSSSRSHLVFAIIVEVVNKQTKVRTLGKLSFVDLAGSEKQKKTETDKAGSEEAIAINLSLSKLGQVIQALATGSSHVPYRDHPLTKLMKDSLGGTAKTLMFVNVSPSVYNESETKNSLDYALRVKKIKNKVNKNIETKETSNLKATIIQLETAVDKFKEVLAKSNMSGELEALEKLLPGFNLLFAGSSQNPSKAQLSVAEENEDASGDEEKKDDL